jgi:hypothetical protein
VLQTANSFSFYDHSTQTPSKDKSTLTIGILEDVYTLNPLLPLTVMAANALSQI